VAESTYLYHNVNGFVLEDLQMVDPKLFRAKTGAVFIGDGSGRYFREGTLYTSSQMPVNILSFFESENSEVWIGTVGGLRVFQESDLF